MKPKQIDWGVPTEAHTYNSNNSWGFGGVRGIKYHFGGLNNCFSALVGLAGTRHHGEFPVITITFNGKLIFDEDNKKKAIALVRRIYKTWQSIQKKSGTQEAASPKS